MFTLSSKLHQNDIFFTDIRGSSVMNLSDLRIKKILKYKELFEVVNMLNLTLVERC